MKTETHPYEFLARWKDGKYSGAHIQFIEVTTNDDGSVAFHKVLNPVPIGDANFPLLDVFPMLNSAAIEEIQRLESALAKVEEENVALLPFIPAKKQAEIDAAMARKAAIEEEIARLTEKP